jgi:hypothetical protein
MVPMTESNRVGGTELAWECVNVWVLYRLKVLAEFVWTLSY